mmetsp:Transcript_25639/g.39452  ORF Transcript_25639/g.39452 Transcript_25639/m.39452 type:complete len:116 (-) Transcript_25639:22-369(-)
MKFGYCVTLFSSVGKIILAVTDWLLMKKYCGNLEDLTFSQYFFLGSATGFFNAPFIKILWQIVKVGIYNSTYSDTKDESHKVETKEEEVEIRNRRSNYRIKENESYESRHATYRS